MDESNILTKSEILLEYAKCLDDPKYAIETYLQTFDKTQSKFVPFKLFPRQVEVIWAYENYRFNLVTKPRQAGVSTTTAAYEAVKIALAPKENPEAVLILANKQDLAFEFLAKIKDFLSQLPRWIWGPDYYGSEENLKKTIFLTDSKKELKLPNNSRVKAVATSKDALRGFTPTKLIMDEAAFIDDGDVVFSTALTALGTGGGATLISTPNGLDPLYYKTYEQSRSGDNDFHIVEMKWYEDLRYNKDLRWLKKIKREVNGSEIDETIEEKEIEFTFNSYEQKIKDGWKPTSSWYEEMCRGMNNNARMIAQELDVSFVGSGGNVIHDDYIEFHEKNNVRDPKYILGADKEIWVWDEPQEGHEYILAADVARGDGADFSTIEIIDFTTMEQVMEYKGKIPPDLFAQIINEWGLKYGEAYAAIDNVGVGGTTVAKLMELDYPNLHWDDPKHKMLVDKRSIKAYGNENKIAGFAVGNVRLNMIANFEQMIRENKIKIRSKRAILEMRTFIWKNGKPDHMSGYNDDALQALAMGLWILAFSFTKFKKAKAQTEAILNSWITSNSITPVTEVNNNQPKKEVIQRPNIPAHLRRNLQDPEGKYLWLFTKKR